MGNFKYLIFFLLITSTNNILSQSTGWIEQQSGTSQYLRSCSFIDSNLGIIVGANGTLLRTTDGGEIWSLIDSGTNETLLEVDFVSNAIGYAVGANGTIIKTIDTGLTWFELSSNTNQQLNSVFFQNENVGFVCGKNGVLLSTTDGGTNWNRNDLDTLWHLNKIFFVDQNIGWICGVRNLYQTKDGGSTWQLNSYGWNVITDISFIDSLNGWGFFQDATGWSVVRNTEDGGENWQFQFIAQWYSEDLFFINELIGWAVGREFIYRTENGGQDWNATGFLYYDLFSDVYFIDSSIGWVVGDYGRILKTINGGVTFIEENNLKEIPNEYSLNQNYPNPFNPNTNISFSIPQSSFVQIKIYDVAGGLVDELVNEERHAGVYNIEWDASHNPTGIYYYQMKAGNFNETKKMLLLK